MQIKVERRLFRVGEDSFAVTLPKAWIVYRGLKRGDAVEITVDEDIVIRARKVPEKTEEGEG